MNSNKDPFAMLARSYPTPERVQKFLRSIPYNKEEGGETLRSAMGALQKRRIHCLEGAMLAAAILEKRGFPTTVVNIDSKDDLCHVIFVYKTKSGWGAVGRSRDEGLHGRKAVEKTL